MQGVRRAEAQLGEACVIGLGLIGQLWSGCSLHPVSVSSASTPCPTGAAWQRQPGRWPVPAPTAKEPRISSRCSPRPAASAATCSWPPAEAAMVQWSSPPGSRGTGREVVDIGKTRLDLPWNAYYEKELDVHFSRSYGPGRYDDRYELQVDYPVGYVRWTERRNLQCFLDLLSTGSLEVGSLVSEPIPSPTPTASTAVARRTLRGVGHLFEYDECRMPLSSPGADQSLASGISSMAPEPVAPSTSPASGASLPPPQRNGHVGTKAALPSTTHANRATVRLGFIGAGNYAASMLLPRTSPRTPRPRWRPSPRPVPCRQSMRSGSSASSTPRRMRMRSLTTRTSTPSSSSRAFTPRGLRVSCARRGQGRLRREALGAHSTDVDRVLAVVERTGNDRLMVGFNRRFAPLFTAPPAIRPGSRPDERALPGQRRDGWTHRAGISTRASRVLDSSARAGTSSTP